MSQEKKNMDLYFEEKIKKSLKGNPSEHFTSNVMHKISLEMQFAREDKKTERITKKFIAVSSFAILAMFVLFGYFLVSGTGAAGSTLAEDITITINRYIYEIQNAVGIQLDLKTMIFGMSFLFIIAIYSISDRFIFRRR